MIKIDKPSVTDLMIPRSAGECCGSKVPFTRKDIMEILSNYITVDSAYTILDEIFIEYIQGDNNLTELILNAVGDVYTREQVDNIVSGLQKQIDNLQEQIDSMTGYTPTPDTGDTPTPDTGDTPTPDSGLTPDFSGNTNRSKYFTLEPVEGDVVFYFNGGDGQGFEWRIDEGEWTYESNWDTTISVNYGSKLELKANHTSYIECRINADGKFKVSGNIFSLVAGDDFYYNDYMEENAFTNFFGGSPIVDASGLYLGSRDTTIPYNSFAMMFQNCLYLTAAPSLPSYNINEYGYYQMFYGCVSLEKAPVLPAYDASQHSYEEMFYGCRNLHYINCNLRNPSQAISWNWVGWSNSDYIPEYGIFIQNPDADWGGRGANSIPYNFDVYTYELDANTNYISAGLEGDVITITINSIDAWEVEYDDWYTVSRRSGAGGENISLRITIPEGDTTRIGVLRISNSYKTIEIPVVRSNQRYVFFDDFPDGTSEDWGYTEPYDPEFVSDFYEHNTLDEYLDEYFDYIDNESLEKGVNMYALIGSMEFEDKTYWVYRQMYNWGMFDDYGGVEGLKYALLDVTRTRDDIYNKSLREDYNNIYQHYNCFDHILRSDGVEYEDIVLKEGAETYIIVDVQ